MGILRSHLKTVTQIVIILLYILQIKAEGISCFQCFASQSGYTENNKLCSQFDGSDRFQVYCPASTLCAKKTVVYKFKSNVTVAVQRYCAPQKRTFQSYDYNDNKWHKQEEIVTTAYEEGCFTGEDRGAPGGPPEYCFCGYHLCNTSQSIIITNVYHMWFLIVSLLFMRFI